MNEITINKNDLNNLIGYIHTIMDFIDTDRDNTNLINDGYMNFVEPIFNILREGDKSDKNTNVYTHDEASRIIELFEGILSDNDIIIPSPEDDDRDVDNEAVLYGSVYSDLLDDVEAVLIGIVEKIQNGTRFTPYVYSGNY